MTRQLTAPVAVTFGVLGPVTAATERGPVPLRGHRQRLVLGRLLIAHGRVVPVDRLVDDLWEVAPDGAVGAIRTFVADLRRAPRPRRRRRRPGRWFDWRCGRPRHRAVPSPPRRGLADRGGRRPGAGPAGPRRPAPRRR
ncbi:hypothetical protein KBX08_14865 [Micromonospora sp. H61]|uniref:AfsR/SARP family transcriptional regulator n=1 Tax=Micromonospora sp. H61 TaxID=2824888 RepID=UPI001B38D6B0|nr:hypothetical protein [Micromonospora sp. H61]MBQ0991364.1 hypothetical protein [Micromonospora sp. H61]